VYSTSLVVDLLEGIVNLVVYCCHAVEPFLGGRRGEFMVIREVYSVRVKAIQATVGRVLVGGCGGSIVSKLSKR